MIKKDYSPIIAVIFLIGIWYLFIGKDLLYPLMMHTPTIQEEQKIYYDFPCSEANLARMIGITLGEEVEVDVVEDALWYEKYYKQLEALGVESLKIEEAFNIVSSQKLKEVFSEITNIKVTIKNKEALQLYEVLEAYSKVLEAKNIPVKWIDAKILATPTDGQDLAAWQVETSEGKFHFEGLVVDALKDQTVQMVTYKEELLGIVEIESTDYKLEEEQPIAIEQENNMPEKDIRVVLSSSSGSYVHDDVILESNESYQLMLKGNQATLEPEFTWKASEMDLEDGEVVEIIPQNKQSQLTLSSLKRGDYHPVYYGAMEVTKVEEGYQIINEVSMEHYVAGVLPSEMPTSYGEEALKAQAVAIRTYGEACMEWQKFGDYGADVDDTTASQVYNRTQTDEKALHAAQQTAGLVLKENGKLISNKFFATSCGYTANFGEVWAGADFPSDTPSYLVSRKQYLGDEQVDDLQEEEDFEAFIKLSAEELDAFDEDSPWFRWQVDLDEAELEKLMKPALTSLLESYDSLITCTTLDGEKQTVENLGALCDMKVKERGKGGNIMKLVLEYEKGKVTVETEYLIRSLFASNSQQDLTVTRSNGSTVSEMSLLPSAFFAIDEIKTVDNRLQSVTLVGGGNGHGVGLSQDGAKGMAERGYKYNEILEHYYKDCEIVKG